METVLYVVLGLIVLVVVAIKAFFAKQGDAKLVIYEKKRTPLVVVDMDDKQVVLKSEIKFENRGTQASVITDMVIRPQLPFEQYDGIDVRGKIERSDAPREDDYFEAYIIEVGESMTACVMLTLTARKGMDIKEALSKMVDLPTDVIYTVHSRKPWALKKFRVIFAAEEIAKAADVKLVED